MARLSLVMAVSGHHSYTPPLQTIERTVRQWLPWAIRQGFPPAKVHLEAHGLQLPKVDQADPYTVRVECRRMPSRRHLGVKVVKLINEATVMVTVQPRRSTWQYPCTIECPSAYLALCLFAAGRPNALIYESLSIGDAVVHGKDQIELGKKRQPRNAPRRLLRQYGNLARDVMAEDAQAAFSYLFQQEMLRNGTCAADQSTVERIALAAINRKPAEDVLAEAVVMPLVDQGVLDPILEKIPVSFELTEYAEELAAQHARRLAQIELDTISIQIANTKKLLEAAQREEERLRQATHEATLRQHSLAAKLGDLHTKERELKRTLS